MVKDELFTIIEKVDEGDFGSLLGVKFKVGRVGDMKKGKGVAARRGERLEMMGCCFFRDEEVGTRGEVFLGGRGDFGRCSASGVGLVYVSDAVWYIIGGMFTADFEGSILIGLFRSLMN